MIHYELAFLIGILGFVYTQLLTDPDQIFNGWYNFLDQKLNKCGSKKHWLFMLLVYCHRCVSGQVALWLYIYYNYTHYEFVNHVLFISFTILISEITNIIYKLTQKWLN